MGQLDAHRQELQKLKKVYLAACEEADVCEGKIQDMLNTSESTARQTDKLLKSAVKYRSDADTKTYDYNVKCADFDEFKAATNDNLSNLLSKIQTSEESRIHFIADIFQKFVGV